ncbi:HAD family hydrolase [Streptomyces sp. HUAS TT20]|uniref:HAD family hydrolase n=1 Tax=Streptomyces sp. HUAS TT20 TaxID=3447509 RepID=UPI0021DA7333|nr:HAD family phosphatase [Streptomyces sp. HUAS 15-9]UXY32248.1 HAD family phosphatase [Streptomyces sp. HUAS 15-9]
MSDLAQAVIFDLDGTLVDSEPLYYESARRLFIDHGVRDYTWSDHEEFVGVGTKETLEVLRERYGIVTAVEELLRQQNRCYLELAGRSMHVFPQMRRLVGLLRGAGLPMAIASGSSRAAIMSVLRSAGLDDMISVVVSAEEVGRGKPAPDVFLEAAQRLGAAPGRCVVIEDAVPGVEAAYRAGMSCIAVPAGGTDVASFATAGLVFAEGRSAFVAETAYVWICGGSARRRDTRR